MNFFFDYIGFLYTVYLLLGIVFWAVCQFVFWFRGWDCSHWELLLKTIDLFLSLHCSPIADSSSSSSSSPISSLLPDFLMFLQFLYVCVLKWTEGWLQWKNFVGGMKSCLVSVFLWSAVEMDNYTHLPLSQHLTVSILGTGMCSAIGPVSSSLEINHSIVDDTKTNHILAYGKKNSNNSYATLAIATNQLQ